MTSTIQRFEQVLTKFERARPEYTSARDAQWERHDQPTIKLSLDTAKSPTKDLESVRLRVVWTFGKDQMAVLEDLDLLAFSPPGRMQRDPRVLLQAVYGGHIVLIRYLHPVTAVLDPSIPAKLQMIRIAFASPDITSQFIRALEVVCACKPRQPVPRQAATPANSQAFSYVPGPSHSDVNWQSSTPSMSSDSGPYGSRSAWEGPQPRSASNFKNSQEINHGPQRLASPPLRGLLRPISPSPPACFLGSSAHSDDSNRMPPPLLPSSSSANAGYIHSTVQPRRPTRDNSGDFRRSTLSSASQSWADSDRLVVTSSQSHVRTSAPTSRALSPPYNLGNDTSMPDYRRITSASDAISGPSFMRASSPIWSEPEPIRSAPLLSAPVSSTPVSPLDVGSTHPPSDSARPTATASPAPALEELSQETFEGLVADIIKDEGFENLMVRLDALWRIKGLLT